MTDLITQINSLHNVAGVTKHECIVSGISNTIENQILKKGDSLPSINQLSNKLGYSRETIVKAYNALKERGILDSKHGLGYFVSSAQIDQKLRIALVLYGFQTFQQTFYNRLRKQLGDDYEIDVFFHHNNKDVYKTILENVRAKYGMYIIAPIQSPEMDHLLLAMPNNKMLIVDRYHYLNDEVAHITQEFEITLSNVFEALEDRINDFDKVMFYFKDTADYPPGIKTAFLSFCSSTGVKYEIHSDYDSDHLSKDNLYFTIGDSDLWALIKDAESEKLMIGKDIGILSHNDSPVKEIIVGGITTFSTDFGLMAEKAANYILDKKMIKEIVPSRLIRRKSL